MSRQTALPFACRRASEWSGPQQRLPRSTSVFFRLRSHPSSQAGRVSRTFPPVLPLPLPRSPHDAVVCAREEDGASVPCGGHPACSAAKRCRVLQVCGSSLFLRRHGLPEALESMAEIPSLPLSSGPAFRPHRGQGDRKATHPGGTRPALP
jgi:hypothetical protein